MAAAQSQGPREIVDLVPNVPVEVALAYSTGKVVNGVNGQRVMFSLADGRVMFLDLGPADRINKLGVKPREPFFVQLKWSGRRGDPKELVAWLAPEAEKRRAVADARVAGDELTAKKLGRSIDKAREIKAGVQGDGTFVVPGIGREMIERAKARAQSAKPAAKSEAAGPVNEPWNWLLGEANGMTDAYASALNYAARHGDRVKAEDVRCFVVAAFMAGRVK